MFGSFFKRQFLVFMSSMILCNAGQRDLVSKTVEKIWQNLQFNQSRSLLECEMFHAQSGCSPDCRSQDFISDMTQWFIPTPARSLRLKITRFFLLSLPCHKVVHAAQTSLYVSGKWVDVMCAGIWRFGRHQRPPKSDSCSVFRRRTGGNREIRRLNRV